MNYSVTGYNPYMNYGYSLLNNKTGGGHSSVFTSQPDTVEISSNQQTQDKKTDLSKNAKLGLGTLALVGIGAAAYILSRGKVGNKQAKQLAEHIEFQPAKTIEEAKAFAKDRLGVNIKFDDIDMANYINEALVTVNNVTKGKSVMPNSVIVDKTNGFYAWRSYTNNTSDLIISSKAYKLGTVAKSKGMSIKDFCEKTMWKDNRFVNKGLSPFKEIFHELGHGNHKRVCKDYNKMAKLKELKTRGISDAHFTEEFISETKNNKVVKDFFDTVGYTRSDGSIYALESPAEFVAEIFSLKVQGKSIPEGVQRIYNKYGGPTLA